MAQIYSWQGELSGPFQSLLGLFALEGAEALGNYIDDILSQMSPAARNRLYRQIMKTVQDARRDLAEKKALSGPDAKSGTLKHHSSRFTIPPNAWVPAVTAVGVLALVTTVSLLSSMYTNVESVHVSTKKEGFLRL